MRVVSGLLTKLVLLSRSHPRKRVAGRRNVLVLNQYAIPRSVGGGTRHFDIFSQLTGWDAKIIAGNRNNSTQEKFSAGERLFFLVPVPPHNGSGGRRLIGWVIYNAQALVFGVCSPNLDAVYASSPNLLTPIVGRIIATIRRVPLIVEIRDLWPESIVAAGELTRDSRLYSVLTWVEKFIVTHADMIVGVTKGWEEHFSDLGVPRGRYVVIPNGADPRNFNTDADAGRVRRKYGVSGVVGVFAGTHGPKDGIHHIIRAAADNKDVSFLMFGDGLVKDDAVASANSLGLTNIHFYQPIGKSDLADVFKASDFGIQSATGWSVFDKGISPNKLFDYLAAGLPVVSNCADAVREVVGNVDCVVSGDEGSLSDSVRRMASLSSDVRLAMGASGRELITERYSRSAAAVEVARILDSVRKNHA